MHPISSTAHAPRSRKILLKWTGVSVVLHVLLLAVLCGISYLGWKKQQAAMETAAAIEEVAAQKAEAERIAKNAAAPAPTPTPASAPEPVQAEAVLGIDQVAKPGETPVSPFAGGDDDLLKDLK